MNNNFYAMILRMKHVHRWGLMRNTWQENLSEHSFDVAVLAHALAVIGRQRLGKQYNAERVLLLALFHDASEIITGDLPTPVKYQNDEIIHAYKNVEKDAVQRLFSMLPEDFRQSYAPAFYPKDSDAELARLLKAADKLSALIKCIEEENAGNREFIVAKQSQLAALQAMELPEADLFLAEFLEGFTKTLDEQ